MSASIFDISGLSRKLMVQARLRSSAFFAKTGRKPCLALIEVGDNDASRVYVARKIADCADIGIEARRYDLPADVSQASLLHLIQSLNQDQAVDGVMVQLPLPDHLDPDQIVPAILPAKDADGLHPLNLCALRTRTPAVIPCTVRGIAHLLALCGRPVQGAQMVIIGRGDLVGFPAALLFGGASSHGNAEVTVLHQQCSRFQETLARADIIIAAAGSAGLVTEKDVREGAVVIDVGMSWLAGQLRGDVASAVTHRAAWMTPPDTSFGAMTRAMLLHNVLDLAERAAS